MTLVKTKILAVDDEKFNLDLLQAALKASNFEVICAEDGEMGLAKLNEFPDIKIILLDRIMPKMDGMQMMKVLKSTPRYKDIPVIMQTAAVESKQVMEGIQAGVYYYLTKPYNKDLLLSVVKRASQDAIAHSQLRDGLNAQKQLLGLIESAHFRFRTLDDVHIVANYVANCCPQSDKVIYGLNELMTNAVEHGNLNITYTDKLELVLEDRWHAEVERRLALPENLDKFATLDLEANPKGIAITIKDQGKGFNWASYMDFDPLRIASDPHGKGIAIARATSFPNMQYASNGTEVRCYLAA